MAHCIFCGQEIDWITSLEGKQFPVDPDPVFVIESGGPDAFLNDMGATITGRMARPEEERRDLPVALILHRRTCLRADKPAPRWVKGVPIMADFCPLPDRRYSVICAEGEACFMWATFPNIAEAIKVMEAWGFQYKTAAFVWVKKNRKNGGNFWGMGAYTRANAEVCLLGIAPGFKAKERVQSHRVHQVIEAPFEGHSKRPDETRRRIVELLGDVPGIELFAASGRTAGTPGAMRPRRNRR